MTIEKKLTEQGAFLFRWRSFIPLLLLIPGIMAFSDSAMVEEKLGEKIEDLWVLAGLIISLCGLGIRWVTVGFVPGSTSGRNTKEQRADHLNTDGMYSVVKNPLYLGNFIAILGVLVSMKVWWLVLVGSLAYWLYIERVIAAEEKFLTEKYGDTYTQWADRTPIFVPDFRLWRKPSMAFSWKTVLKREYNGLMAIGTAFFVIEFIVDVVIEGEGFKNWVREDWPWVAGFALAAVIFLFLRTLKKHTRMLKVEGR